MTHGGGILGDHVCEINHGSGNTGKLDISHLSGFESAAKRIVFNGRLIDLSGCIWRSRFTFSMVTSVDPPLGCKALDNISVLDLKSTAESLVKESARGICRESVFHRFTLGSFGIHHST